MTDFNDDPGRGFRRPRIAISDPRTGAVVDLPESVAVGLLESEPRVRRDYLKYFMMARQWMVQPELRRGRLIIIDREIVLRLLEELGADAPSEAAS
jgi:hypothetical protein